MTAVLPLFVTLIRIPDRPQYLTYFVTSHVCSVTLDLNVTGNSTRRRKHITRERALSRYYMLTKLHMYVLAKKKNVSNKPKKRLGTRSSLNSFYNICSRKKYFATIVFIIFITLINEVRVYYISYRLLIF